MAKQLAEAGILTCVIQYTLYPDALAPQMVDELSQALTWTFKNISQHGGDPEVVCIAHDDTYLVKTVSISVYGFIVVTAVTKHCITAIFLDGC